MSLETACVMRTSVQVAGGAALQPVAVLQAHLPSNEFPCIMHKEAAWQPPVWYHTSVLPAGSARTLDTPGMPQQQASAI